ncbi:MAG: hypothetical protein AAGC56_10895 [Pseudomonadota bacterium]
MIIAALLAAAAVATFEASDDAAAQSADRAWAIEDLQKTDRGSKRALGTAMYTADAGAPGILFLCTDGKIMTAISVEPADLTKAMTDAGKLRETDVELTLGDGEPERHRWLMAPRHDTLIAPVGKISSRLYNAVVRGDQIALDPRTRDAVAITAPAPSAETFSEFRERCGLQTKSS